MADKQESFRDRKSEDEEEHEDEQEETEEDEGFVPGEKKALKEQLEMDKDDESLRKWKEQLLGDLKISGDEKPEPELEFRTMRILVEDRDAIELPIPKSLEESKTAKVHFVLKERCKYKIQFEFTVKNEILLGLTYSNKVFRLGRQVDKSKLMLGAYGPQADPYTFVTEEEEAPHGMLVRGTYTAKTTFSDDDGKTHLEFDYTFEIKKDW